VKYERKFFGWVLSKGLAMKMNCGKARKNISLAMDGRLGENAVRKLDAHLELCPACREWRQEQLFLQEMFNATVALRPVPDFFDRLQKKINRSSARPWFSFFEPYLFKPVMLRVALLMLLVLSTALGFFLGGPLPEPAADPSDAAFSQAMNLDAFADLPVDSFGGVYERLLQGEVQ
jgi:anti-sigma factor RsiW